MTDRKKGERSSIDGVQAATIDEHYETIMANNTYIDAATKNISHEDLPDWFDERLFKRGQKYFQQNLLGFLLAHTAGLIAIFLIPSIAKILSFTKKSSTPCTAFTRYLRTILYSLELHSCDFTDPKSNFYKAINIIRWKHLANRKCIIDGKEHGILLKDMVLTQFAFMAYILMRPKIVGLSNTTEEREGINHVWRVIGYLLGIPDRMNLCRRNEYETTLLCKKLLNEVFQQHIKKPSKEFNILTTAAIEGMSSVDPSMDLDAFLTFFYEINGSTYKKKISTYSKINYLYKKANFYLITLPLIGDIVRISWNIYLRSILWLFTRFPIFGIFKYGKEKSKILMYSYEL